jgi:asparagine synthetase B (glutamine-hydrolysing)
LGQRQLYYRGNQEYQLFCSELLPLLEDCNWGRQLDRLSAVNYLTRGLPLPGRTLAEGIRSLPAAHFISLDEHNDLTAKRYWTPLSSYTEEIAFKRLKREIKEALHQGIEQSVVPAGGEIALLLSGGVDSSYVAARAVEKLPSKALSSLTIQYDPKYGINENEYAVMAAHQIGIDNSPVALPVAQAGRLLQEVLSAPVPCSAWTAITHHQLLRSAKERGMHRVISGLGSDEIFGGYDRYLDYYFRQRRFAMSWNPACGIDWFEAILHSPRDSDSCLFPGMASFFSEKRLRDSLHFPISTISLSDFDRAFYRECREMKPNAHLFEMMIAHECHHRIPDLLLSDFEPIARGLGVCTAYPFLHPLLAQRASFLGPSDRYWHEHGYWWAKKFFRQVSREVLPESIVMRPRAAYDAPIVNWLADRSFQNLAIESFSRSSFWECDFLLPQVKKHLLNLVRDLPRSARRKNPPWIEEFWAVLTLSAWFDRYIGGRK